MKKGMTILLALVMLVMLAVPVGVLAYISRLEQEQYRPEEPVVLEELAYGAPEQPIRMELKESVTLSGQVVSTKILYEELALENAYDLRLQIQSGQVLQEGDVIGIYNGEPVTTKTAGLVRSVNLGSKPYIELYDLNSLAIECSLDADQLKVLRRSSLALSDNGGHSYELLRLEDRTANATALLSCPEVELLYGQQLSLSLFTGRNYPDSLMISKNCVYSTDGGSSWYVRTVDAEGHILEEIQVQVGYEMGNMVCISGIDENTYCDSGYGAVLEGGQ